MKKVSHDQTECTATRIFNMASKQKDDDSAHGEMFDLELLDQNDFNDFFDNDLGFPVDEVCCRLL